MQSNQKPLYVVIMEDLKEKILSGEYKEEQQLPTEVELAEQSGVSRITSKRALIELEREGLIYRKRGSGSYVKKQEQRGSQGEMGANTSTPIISMILPYMATSELDFIKGATDYLDTKGYYLSIHNSNWSKEREREFLLRIPKNGSNGIILYPISTISNIDVLNVLYWNDYPLVMIDQYVESLPVTSVVSDNFNGGYMIAKQLIALGHERIAFISSIAIEFRSSVRDRYQGYCKALRDHGLPVDPELTIVDFYREADMDTSNMFYKNMISRIMELGVTAIQAEHDHLAVDLLRSALEMGIQVPGQLSIAGFDDHMISSLVEVPLTTIAQDYSEIGRKAAELIVSQIEERDKSPERALVPVRLVERASTSALSDEYTAQEQI
ncbi:GntR family transcriptional regulator [Paenibacillus dokdonensis]|uniref:GntR family transcriptional regulator n=1 Tax=Paenibacillus dokdonensis TaxID=2567944 RepID=A0ABU6GIH2_9BACL|nr:GntR family transcriptional regulator [Paenibacillus dokdonensis]MEC0239003.1 GntR family transcriptional regulator [Paenibacillus dokdonensis]